MTLAPLIVSHMLDNFGTSSWDDSECRRHRMLSSHMRPVFGSLQIPIRSGHRKPCFQFRIVPEDSTSPFKSNENEFKVSLDVQQFKPDELRVTINENMIVVEGKHEERSDEHGFVSRQFTRKYTIPSDVDKTAIVSKLSSDGVLVLQAPKMVKEGENKVIEIPITHTNQPIRIQQINQSPQS